MPFPDSFSILILVVVDALFARCPTVQVLQLASAGKGETAFVNADGCKYPSYIGAIDMKFDMNGPEPALPVSHMAVKSGT